MDDERHKTFDGDVLANALTSGFHRVIGQQELLNRINVYPVADADTGTNLSLSLSAALTLTQRSDSKILGSLLTEVADLLLDSARGNSGAIVAQFFQGMSDSAGDVTQLTTATFSQAISKGNDYARDALSKPQEGTILSVIAAFSDSVSEQTFVDWETDIAKVVVAARSRVEIALANTTRQLPVLQNAGVVDAGAKGFAELIGGFSDYLNNGVVSPLPENALLDKVVTASERPKSEFALRYRYCTECLVVGANINRRKLREALTELGDSMVLAGSMRKARVHIHVNEPVRVFEVARQFGDLRGAKADDMHRQQNVAHKVSQGFAVITDSAADISDADTERLDIHMVPCRIQFGDRGYLDKVSITTDEFYSELERNPHHPTTSQPSPGDFRRQFQFLASHFTDVLSINLTSRASGTCESARAAANRIQAPGKIHVIDSRNASMAQGQLVVLAAECAQAGISIEETIKAVQEQIPRTKTYALVKDLRYAVRGGRVPRWVKTIADLLHLNPVLSTRKDGRIALGGFLIGRRNRIRRFAKFVARRAPTKLAVEIGIAHAVCLSDADELAAEMRQIGLRVDKLTICKLGTGIGVHGGPGTLIVSMRPVDAV